ncbi:MAG: hypothetical protein L6R40_008130 [Gallowayella cf. fulva]|nr:MAG: hypothetical protein L6R40_008130 [Xanthomendoza cf. fulva]
MEVGYKKHNYPVLFLMSTNFNMSREEVEILKWFKHYACEEQKMQHQISGLTDQVNLLSRNLNSCVVQLNHKHHSLQSTSHTLNAANKRIQELEQVLSQSERSRAICDNELHFERAAHASTKDYLAQEFEHHNRADSALARQAQAMKNLSDFLELMQGTSDDAKEATVQTLANRNDMGTLMMELEDKKQALAELEDQRQQEHAQFEHTTKYYQEQCTSQQHLHSAPSRELDSSMDVGSAEEVSHGAATGRRMRSKRIRAQRGRMENKTEDESAV